MTAALHPSVRDAIDQAASRGCGSLSIADAARIAGFRTSTFYAKARQAQLPFPVLVVGQRYRIPIGPFEAWLSGEASQ